MDIFLILLVNIVYLSVHISLSSRLNRRNLVRKKTVIAFNTVLILMLLSYPIINQGVFGGNVRDALSDSYWGVSNLFIILETVPFLLLSPYFWTALIYYLTKIFFSKKLRRNSKIKESDFDYYREDLEKFHPGLVSFVCKLRYDPRSDVAAILMKLKIEGYIEEKDGKFYTTGKNDDGLFDSEKAVLNAVRGESFDMHTYYDIVANEAMERRLIKRPNKNFFLNAFKILIYIAIPIALYMLASSADDIFKDMYERNLIRWPGGVYYFRVNKETYDKHDWISQTNAEIDQIPDPIDRIKPRGELLQRIIREGSPVLDEDDKSFPRVENFEVEGPRYFVRLDLLLGLPGKVTTNSIRALYGFLWTLFIFSIALSIALFVSQVKTLNASFVRTAKGAALVNDAYGLKNYLKDFSAIKERELKELPLWEYYLIYAVALDVNFKIEDGLIVSFTRSIV